VNQTGAGPAGITRTGSGSATLSPIPGRLVSLDAFRGLTIAGMILVNNPGSWAHVYPPLRHAEWHGCTPTDLIFPFFLFIVGVSIVLSQSRQREGGAGQSQLRRKILRRTALIFALGLFLNAFPRFDLGSLRCFGVLQRIALTYGAAALIVLYAGRRVQAGIAGGLLLGYWALMTLVPVPGFGAGDLGLEGNLAAWLDRTLLAGHTWRELYDPEGLLSTIPAVATVLIGVATGYLLQSKRAPEQIVNRLFVLGWAGILSGAGWGLVFPVNKALWTSSYVLLTAGAALELLALCYWLIEVRGGARWARPAILFGLNPLAIFVGSGLLVKLLIRIPMTAGGESPTSLYTWLYRQLFVPWAGEMNGSLAFAVANVLFWLGVAAVLYRRRIFIKI